MLKNINPTEAVNTLTKLADLVGKQTLVIWCIVTTFSTGYLYVAHDKSQESRIKENKASYEMVIEEIKGIKKTTAETKEKVDSTIPKLDSTIINVNQTMGELKRN